MNAENERAALLEPAIQSDVSDRTDPAKIPECVDQVKKVEGKSSRLGQFHYHNEHPEFSASTLGRSQEGVHVCEDRGMVDMRSGV